MSPLEAVVLFLAGGAAGAINTVVGSGTLITFPTLLAFGVPPVTANVSNTIGLVPGSLSGAWGYRHELAGQGSRIRAWGSAAVLGGLAGGLLLLALPSSAFDAIVPALILLGVVLVLAGPRIAARSVQRGHHRPHGARWVWPAIAGTGVYGGYFGAAQGVLLMAVLGAGIDDDVQRHNAAKNVLAAMINGVAAVLFMVVADVDWSISAVIAAGAILGGQLGARVGRRLSPAVLRGFIVTVGIVALVVFLR